MRSLLLTLTACILLFACNNSATNKKPSNDTVKVSSLGSKVETKSERQILIEELKNLQTVFASKNKEKIASIFKFPLNLSEFTIYMDDVSFNNQLEKNGDKITEDMFINYFPQISESVQIDQFNKIFKKLNLDSLLQKNDLIKNETIITEPCYTYYNIKIEKNFATLIFGEGTNQNYVSKSNLEDEDPLAATETCDYEIKWGFKFDGKKLHIKNILYYDPHSN